MVTIDARATGPRGRLTEAAREWWPVPVLLALAVVAQDVLLSSRYDVGGHAAGHLDSASVPFMAAVVLAILVWATPAVLRQVDVVVCVVAWLSATVVMMVGNLRVVDDLVAAGYSHTPTGSVPDVADHSLANTSVWYAVAAALLLVGSLRWRRHIGNGTAVGATIATVVFPPWIVPGAGVVVATIVRCVSRHRERCARRRGPPSERHVGSAVSTSQRGEAL
jgi:hypothetical protein